MAKLSLLAEDSFARKNKLILSYNLPENTTRICVAVPHLGNLWLPIA